MGQMSCIALLGRFESNLERDEGCPPVYGDAREGALGRESVQRVSRSDGSLLTPDDELLIRRIAIVSSSSIGNVVADEASNNPVIEDTD